MQPGTVSCDRPRAVHPLGLEIPVCGGRVALALSRERCVKMNRLNQTSSHVVCTPCTAPSPVAAESVVSGECNCGAVTYSVTGDPLNVLICHCQDCREAHGSPMSTVFVTKADQVTIDGPIGEYDRRGQNKRTFCTNCGTPMASNLYKAGLYAFFVPSIRSGSVGPPKMHIYLNEKAPEVALSDDLLRQVI